MVVVIVLLFFVYALSFVLSLVLLYAVYAVCRGR
jgi:hypothetical protein